MSWTRLELIMVVATVGCGLGCTEADQIQIEGPFNLEYVREIIKPGLTDETLWIGRSRRLLFDPQREHLLTINMDAKTVLEIDLNGNLVRSYGREGEGPGELQNPLGLAASATAVFALDLGNMKIGAFPRSGGDPEEIRLISYYSVLAPLGGNRLLVGVSGTAFDILDLTGERVGGFGDRDELRGYCNRCVFDVLDDERVAVANGDPPELLIIHKRDGILKRIDFLEIPPLSEWTAEMAEIVRRSGVAMGGRIWLTDLKTLDGNTVLMSVTPQSPAEEGRELWKVKLDKDEIVRYRFDRPSVGAFIAAKWPSIYATGAFDGALHEYRVPDGK